MQLHAWATQYPASAPALLEAVLSLTASACPTAPGKLNVNMFSPPPSAAREPSVRRLSDFASSSTVLLAMNMQQRQGAKVVPKKMDMSKFSHISIATKGGQSI